MPDTTPQPTGFLNGVVYALQRGIVDPIIAAIHDPKFISLVVDGVVAGMSHYFDDRLVQAPDKTKADDVFHETIRSSGASDVPLPK